MLKRIYIDNFRCFVNFELPLESINLFLGPNGAGKSTVFDVLRKIQRFINGDKVYTLFSSFDLTRWHPSSTHTFKLEFERKNELYKYELAVEHSSDGTSHPKIAYERIWVNNQPLLKFEAGTVQLYTDDYSESSNYAFNQNQSVTPSIPVRRDNTKLHWLKKRIDRLIVVQINPMLMSEKSNQEETLLSSQTENFVSWYRHVSQNQGKVNEITNALQEVLDGFDFFKFDGEGKQERLLGLRFSNKNNEGISVKYGFDELSDGQRVLIALYALIYYARSEDYTLCIDEPENFVALSEIQPWLELLYDFCDESELQALLISHHPNLIDRLAVDAGYWFDRESNKPVQVKRITEEETGIPISELVARGWLYG